MCGVGVGFLGGFAKKGYTPLFRRQKGAHLENVWAIYKKHSMISNCSSFWGKKTEEYPPSSVQLNKYPFLAVENIPFGKYTKLFPKEHLDVKTTGCSEDLGVF